MSIRDWAKARSVQKGALAMLDTRLAAGKDTPMNGGTLKLLPPIRPVKIARPQSAANYFEFTSEENVRFLRLVTACAQVSTRYELFLLVHGQLQFFLPQDILIAAWGNFRSQDPYLDVISNVPDARTYRTCGTIVPIVKHLYNIWIDGGRKPVLLNDEIDELQACTNDACALPCNFSDMRLSLVHGIQNRRDGHDSLYIALRRHPFAINGAETRLRFLADPVIHQVDVAHRKVAALQTVNAPSDEHRNSLLQLSAREREIAHWVCQGKTNGQIAQILGISVNTVKNHLHRIFAKLGANNRTELVVKYTDVTAVAESELTSSN